MRLDKYLKVSRLIRRRTLAKEVCDSGKVIINDRAAKASSEVKPGDIIIINFGTRQIKAKVLLIAENMKADLAKEMYSIIE